MRVQGGFGHACRFVGLCKGFVTFPHSIQLRETEEGACQLCISLTFLRIPYDLDPQYLPSSDATPPSPPHHRCIALRLQIHRRFSLFPLSNQL